MSEHAVGVVGVGRIGLPFARALLRHGSHVIGYRRHDRDQLPQWGVRPASSAASLAEQAELVFTCLPTSESLLSVVAEIAEVQSPRLVLVDLSMLPLAVKQEARALLSQTGAGMLDAPISGTPAMTLRGEAIIFSSGDRSAHDRAAETMCAVTRAAPYLGTFGAGSCMKIISNGLVAIHTAAAAEAITLARAAGLDPARVVELIGNSAAASEQFRIRAPLMAAGDFREPPMQTVGAFSKDLGIIGEYAMQIGVQPEVFLAASRLYARAFHAGVRDGEIAQIVDFVGRRDPSTLEL